MRLCRPLPPTAAHADQEHVAALLLQDAVDPANVIHCVFEEDEVHRDAAVNVVLVQRLLELELQGRHIGELLVRSRVRVREEVAEVGHDTVVLEDAGPLGVRVGLYLVVDHLPEPLAIIQAVEPVTEDAGRLVHEQPQHRIAGVEIIWVRLHDALNNLGHVAHVEQVHRAGRSRQLLLLDRMEDIDQHRRQRVP